jgi:hypothetical protein
MCFGWGGGRKTVRCLKGLNNLLNRRIFADNSTPLPETGRGRENR